MHMSDWNASGTVLNTLQYVFLGLWLVVQLYFRHRDFVLFTKTAVNCCYKSSIGKENIVETAIYQYLRLSPESIGRFKVTEHSFSSAQRLVSGATHCGADFNCKTKMATTLIFPCSCRFHIVGKSFCSVTNRKCLLCSFFNSSSFSEKTPKSKIFL